MIMDEISKALKDVRAQRVGNMLRGCGAELPENPFEKAEENDIEKSQENGIDGFKEEIEENPFEKAVQDEEEDSISKSDIMNALDYGSSIKVIKTGKELKEQVTNVLLPQLNAELEVKKSEATEKLSSCGVAPNSTPDPWWTRDIKIDCGFKVYDWNDTYIPREDSVSCATLSASDAKDKLGNVPENQEQANARRDYNDIVRSICNIYVDIKACEILSGLDDSKEYEMTPRQILTLQF